MFEVIAFLALAILSPVIPVAVLLPGNIPNLDAPNNAAPARSILFRLLDFFDMSFLLINNIRIYVLYNFRPHPRQHK